MERDQVKEVFKVLAYAYPKFEVTSEKLNFWHKFLIDQNPATVMKKVERHVMEKPFPPAIADLRETTRNSENTTSVIAKFWQDQG